MTMQTDAELSARLASLGVREEDLLERFVRSRGPGGQHVNKTSTAVHLTHVPTGIEVKSQGTRSQRQNRLEARERLAVILEQRRAREQQLRAARAHKSRAQSKRRSRGAKERILADKRQMGEKKRSRQKPRREE